MGTLKLLIVDDDPKERNRFATSIVESGTAEVLVAGPPTDLDALKLLEGRPDAILIDYQLNERGNAETRVAYRGTSLAAAIREKTERIPVILLTRPAILNKTGLHASPGLILTAFDEIVVKDDLLSETAQVCRELAVLVHGFQALARVKTRSWEALVRLLKASKEQTELLRRADPPPGLLSEQPWNVEPPSSHPKSRSHMAKTRWTVSDVSHWLRKVVLAYPGIVYSPPHAAARLGLTVASFERPHVQSFFKRARYSGVFAPIEGRWWANHLLLVAKGLLVQQGMADRPVADFADAWRKAGKGTLQQSRCNSSGRTPADTICYVLGEPVMREQSLPYRPDGRPACMDEARVSFKAIRKTDRFDERLFPPDARGLLREIESPDEP